MHYVVSIVLLFAAFWAGWPNGIVFAGLSLLLLPVEMKFHAASVELQKKAKRESEAAELAQQIAALAAVGYDEDEDY